MVAHWSSPTLSQIEIQLTLDETDDMQGSSKQEDRSSQWQSINIKITWKPQMSINLKH